MSPFSLVLAVIIPAVLMLAYGLIKTGRQVSREALWAGFLGGLIVAVALIGWETAIAWVLPLNRLPPLGGAAGQAFFIAAIPEEGAKFCALLLVIRRFVYLGDVPDTILAALGVALGFAVAENAGYVIHAYAASAIAGGVIALLRSVTAVPEHVAFGLTMGALIAGTRGGGHGDVPENPGRMALALVLPIVMHGAYDFLLMAHARLPSAGWTIQWLPIVMAISLLSAILLCNNVLRHAAGIDRMAALGAAAPATLGCFLLLLGLLMVGLVLLVPVPPVQQALTVYCVVPLLLGLDLLGTFFYRP
jgi:RsiW-degrading membrane proteinase PrsW (M82 family)